MLPRPSQLLSVLGAMSIASCAPEYLGNCERRESKRCSGGVIELFDHQRCQDPVTSAMITLEYTVGHFTVQVGPERLVDVRVGTTYTLPTTMIRPILARYGTEQGEGIQFCMEQRQ